GIVAARRYAGIQAVRPRVRVRAMKYTRPVFVPNWAIATTTRKADVAVKNTPARSGGSPRVTTTVSPNVSTADATEAARFTAPPRATPPNEPAAATVRLTKALHRPRRGEVLP